MDLRRARPVAALLAGVVLLAGCQTAGATTGRGTAPAGSGSVSTAAGAATAPSSASSAVASPAGATSPGAAPTGPADPAPPAASPSARSAATAATTAAPGNASRPAPTAPAPARAQSGTALATLGLLAVKGRAPMTGYSRAQFGPAWKDVDRNGCDTRNDILARDLTGTVRSGGCRVLSGTLHDPYSGETIAFTRGASTSSAVQIDHVVALGDAWQTGAQQWDATRRTALANDPLNLLAVKGSVNEQKGDGDAATWLPPRTAARCAYVARQVAVKYTYRLWVTRAERDAIARVLAACPDQRLPKGSAVPPAGAVAAAAAVTDAGTTGGSADASGAAKPAAAAPAKPAPAKHAAAKPAPAKPAPAKPAAPAASFKNCAAAWAAGAAPLHRGDAGYAPKLDRDGDGVACESRP